MKIKSFGCSFIYGCEMADTLDNTRYSRTAWPALLARHLGVHYRCYARGGCGNLQIAEQILNQLTRPHQGPDLYIINWTYIERFDYTNCRLPRVAPKSIDDPGWDTIRPGGNFGGQEQLADWYFRNIQSDYRDKLTSLMQISLCVQELQQAGHKFIMTYMDDLLFDQQYHFSPAIKKLQADLQPLMQTFEGMNMVEYSRSLGHQINQHNHPLESAHQDLFEYALGHFLVDEIKTS